MSFAALDEKSILSQLQWMLFWREKSVFLLNTLIFGRLNIAEEAGLIQGCLHHGQNSDSNDEESLRPEWDFKPYLGPMQVSMYFRSRGPLVI
jgi:hypothetical protein